MADRTFYTEDVVTLQVNRRDLAGNLAMGIIERSPSDVDTHTPQPDRDYEKLLCHKDVPKAEFRKFKKTGVPPPNTVLVEWQGPNTVELVPIEHLYLVDRALLVGDVVKRNTRDAMSGTVVETEVCCVLKPASTLQLQLPDIDAAGRPMPYPSLKTEELLLSISADELMPANKYQEDSLVIYHDWIGRIEAVNDDITVRLSNQSLVTLEDHKLKAIGKTDGDTRLEVGDIVKTSKHNTRRGTWLEGQYDASVQPVGDVVKVRPREIIVGWLCRRLHSGSNSAFEHEPARNLYPDMLGNNDICVYDRSRSPKGLTTHVSYGKCVDFLIGSSVRFKDPAGAALKYDGTKPDANQEDHKNYFQRIPATLGIDLNVFTILSMSTKVTVLWQDCNLTHEDSKVLVPDINLEDESEVWPGELVVSNETVSVPGHDWIVQPKRVGVVQSVSAEDRVAAVLWLLDAKIQYLHVADVGEDYTPPSLLPGSTLGLTLYPDPDVSRLNAPTKAVLEDVTLYDMKPAEVLNKRRGDFVMLHPPEQLGINTSSNLDWIGEVVDLGIDGFLTVRLGALENVRDIRIAPEYTSIIWSSDGTHAHPDGTIDDDTASDGSYSDEDSEIGVWETPNGEPIEEDSDAEQWLTESEEDSEDVDMQDVEEEDAPPPQTPEPDREETAFETAPSTPQVRTATKAPEAPIYTRTEHTPESFAILETAPPDSTPYLHPAPQALSSSLMKRIAKEHKILANSLPDGIFVRTWESRLDLLRILIVGPIDTPYEFVSFVIDMRLPPDYPYKQPEAYFHSWTSGNGPVNPNLYENGTICLSLLGTWHTGKDKENENWSPAHSTILQVLVSIIGLVLVKEPYFNEAGFEVRAGLADAAVPSALYSERTYFRSRAFIRYILANQIDGFMDVIGWLYLDPRDTAPQLLDRALRAGEEVLASGENGTGVDRGGLTRVSKGALVMLKRELEAIKAAKDGLLAEGLPDWVMGESGVDD
jgi:ubiquitin-conjugating enzyme E2 O